MSLLEDRTTLINLNKDELIEVILNLKGEITKMNDDFKKITNLRLYHLERNANMYHQYGRRESFEVVGIPADVDNLKLEDEVIGIMKEAKVSVNNQPIKRMDICAVHRIGKKGTTIVRVVNRKFSKQAMFCGKNLKNSKRYGNDTKVFINPSFCPEFHFLNYAVRKAFKEKHIYKYKVRNGVTCIQMLPEGNFVEIGHELDLENLNIPIPERRDRN